MLLKNKLVPMSFPKKRTIVPLTLIILCIITRGLFWYSLQTNPFTSLCKEITLDTLQDNPFELHFSIAYPEKIGLNNLSTNLIPFHENYYEDGKVLWSKRAEFLSKAETTALNKENAFLHRLLERHINLQLDSLNFPYYSNPLSPSGGIHSQLPILLSEYAFRSKEDVENYLLLLSQIPDYLEGLARYTALRESHGLPLYNGSLEQIQTQCLELFPEAQLKGNSHLLQSGFLTRLETLLQKKLISEEEMSAFVAQNNQLLSQQIAPAYQSLANSIGTLRGRTLQAGLSSYPNGQEYYSLLLKANTGSDRSVEEIRSLLYARYDMLYNAYSSMSLKNTTKTYLEFDSPQEMLQHLYACSQAHFPSLQLSDSGAMQKVQLKTVDGILASMSAPAFYMTPPLDANEEHTIYINPTAKMESLDLYTTLAHEGFPGHLYQTVYSQNALLQQNAPLLQYLLYYGGFTEGWAVYAELYAYDYAKNLIFPAPQSAADIVLADRYHREIQLCLCSILDIYIHYDGATLQDVKELLTTLGLNSASADSLYAAICEAPANYPKYYVGYLEILELKNTAKKLWGSKYSDYEFHKWLLETGGGDFSSLTWKLTQESS
jgi:uncharacterized protein (DUF885 family)